MPESTEKIQGKPVGSKEELWLSKALYKLRHSFEYQAEFHNGRRVRGGQVIDWMVNSTVPLPTPVFFHGDYWHEGDMGQEDRFKFIQVEQDLKGSTNPLVIFWQKDVSSQEDADRVILQRLGTG